ncbi:MAG: sigma factor-like helix-turn-helix DNA-binding protein [Eubacteriales bacterium]|jgi:hypothetical protein
MANFDYKNVIENLLKESSSRSRDIIGKRFGLISFNGKKSTLEAIGEEYGLTRERVRQIEEDSMKGFKETLSSKYPLLSEYFKEAIKTSGGARKEETLVKELGAEEDKNRIVFLLNLVSGIKKYKETDSLYPFWALDEKSAQAAKKEITDFSNYLAKKKIPVSLEEYLTEKKSGVKGVSYISLASWIEISKKVGQNREEKYGFLKWPEIIPKWVKDKAYIVLKQEHNPLHFSEIARLVGERFAEGKVIYPNIQTVHNELIKDDKFVLIGRGTYALAEWGYKPGVVKEVISEVLKTSAKPLNKGEIIRRVSQQRMVKENTILLNLNDRSHFFRDSQGRYRLREA